MLIYEKDISDLFRKLILRTNDFSSQTNKKKFTKITSNFVS